MAHEEYLDKLILERLYEIHIYGWIETKYDIISHVKVNNAAYEVPKNVVTKYDPEMVTLEYGRDDERIAEEYR